MNSEHLPTHRDLLPKNVCPHLMMKQVLISALDDPIYDERDEAGDGYNWCARTCTEIGPDDRPCRPNHCVPGRACYDGFASDAKPS